ncbi:MAG TPA: Uma2 family endonuclease [Longimicrobium sp.]|nr:Uma2 family endonuclease [Longimicrobium sp.]
MRFPNRVSYEEFLATMEGKRAEWVDGEVELMSPASSAHEGISAFLLTAFRGFVARRGIGGRVMLPYQMKLARSGREPDVIYVAAENLPRIRRTYIDGSADMVVEVVSPDSRIRDRRTKYLEYEEAGVREYWIVDPMKRTAEVFRLGWDGKYAPVEPGDPPRLVSEVIPGLWIDPAWLWVEAPDEWTAYREWGLV